MQVIDGGGVVLPVPNFEADRRGEGGRPSGCVPSSFLKECLLCGMFSHCVLLVLSDKGKKPGCFYIQNNWIGIFGFNLRVDVLIPSSKRALVKARSKNGFGDIMRRQKTWSPH